MDFDKREKDRKEREKQIQIESAIDRHSEAGRAASQWRLNHSEGLIRAREIERDRLAALTQASLDALDKVVQKFVKK